MAGTTGIVTVLLGVCAVTLAGILAKAKVEIVKIRARSSK